MTYTISRHTRSRARQLGVSVRKSTNPKKKLDVFKNGKKVASIGARGYGDYPTFLRKYGKSFAEKRRRLYKSRHSRNRSRKGSAGYYADKLLW